MAGLHETLIEIVKFQESGLTEIAARTRVFKEQLDEATKRGQTLAAVLGDPAYAKHAARMNEMARSTERMSVASRNASRSADLASGSFSRHAAAMAKLNAESRKLDQREKLAGLVAEHGRYGAVVRHNAAELALLGRTALGVTGLGVAMGVGLMRSGLQGTVEGYRLEYAWTRLSRQLAAIAIPAIDMLSRTIGRVAGWFEKLSGPQQNTILKFGLLTAGGLALVGVLRSIITVGTAAAAVIRTIGVVSGLAGVGGAAAATGGVAAGGAAAGVGATAGLAAMSRRPTAAPAALKPAPAVAPAASGAAANAAVGTGLLARAGGFVSGLAKASGVAIIAGGIAKEVMGEQESFYRLNRNAGRSKASSFILGGIQSMTEFTGLYDLFGEDRRKELKGKQVRNLFKDEGKPGEDHRNVTPLQVGMEEAGGAFFRIQEEVLKSTAAQANAADTQMGAAKLMKDAADAMLQAIREAKGGQGGPGDQGGASFIGGYAKDLRDRIAGRKA